MPGENSIKGHKVPVHEHCYREPQVEATGIPAVDTLRHNLRQKLLGSELQAQSELINNELSQQGRLA